MLVKANLKSVNSTCWADKIVKLNMNEKYARILMIAKKQAVLEDIQNAAIILMNKSNADLMVIVPTCTRQFPIYKANLKK